MVNGAMLGLFYNSYGVAFASIRCIWLLRLCIDFSTAFDDSAVYGFDLPY